jgi:ferredoxin
MALRKIIEIDEDTCDGCGNCIPNCPEGALQVIDGKARLISDLFCDGLGACIGECPVGAIKVIEREARPYNETKVMENIARQGENVVAAHLKHLRNHGETNLYNEALEYLKKNNIKITKSVEMKSRNSGNKGESPRGCPGSVVMDRRGEKPGKAVKLGVQSSVVKESKLRQWPIQIMLVPSTAPYLKNANLLIVADCVPFAYSGFHEDFLESKTLLIGCPKFDDSEFYIKKFTEIFRLNEIESATVVHMEVPCCFSMLNIVKQAVKNSGKNIAVEAVNIGIKGNIIL